MRRLAVLATGLLALSGASAAQAQDWLTPHLESQRWNNLNNNRNRSDRDGDAREGTRALPRCTVDMVPGAERRQVEAEFQRRVRTQGYDRAHAWSVEQGRLARQRLEARGVCR